MNKTVKNSAIYFVGTMIMALLGFVSTMLLTRVLSERVYAMYGLLTSFVTALATIISLGYDASYSRFFYLNSKPYKKYLFDCIKYPIIVFLLLLVGFFEPKHFLIRYVFGENFSPFLILFISIHIFLTLIQRFSQITARMTEHALNYIISNTLAKSGFVAIIFSVFLCKGKVSFLWVVLSFIISLSAGIITNLPLLSEKERVIYSHVEEINQRALLSFGFPLMVNNSLTLLIPMFERVIIRSLAGWKILSIYTAAAIFQTVVSLLINTLDNIWNPLVYQKCDNPKEFKPLLHKFGMLCTIITSVGLALCILFRRYLVIILAENYHSVFIIIPALVYGSCLNIISAIYGIGINIQKKTYHLIISSVIQVVFSVLLCYMLIPRFSLIGVALASLISIVMSRIYRIAVGLYYYNTGVRENKAFLIWGISIIVAFATMFLTGFVSDIIIFILFVIFIFFIANKDLRVLLKLSLLLLKKEKGI